MIKPEFITGNAFEWRVPPFQTLITSPPYYAKRRYDIPDVIMPPIAEGRNLCAKNKHEWSDTLPPRPRSEDEPAPAKGEKGRRYTAQGGQFCDKCGAFYGQLGAEPYIELYIDHLATLLARFAQESMAEDGTMWINIGDTYCAHERAGAPKKGLFGVPYRLALELQNEYGLIWRNTIIWHKSYGLPEPVKDRLPGAHEVILVLAKSQKTKFYREAILNSAGVSLRDVWEMPGANHRSKHGDHMAPMPLELARRAILLSTDPGDRVFDPFGGTGTTAAQAVALGREVTSIDLDGRQEDFFKEHLVKLGANSQTLPFKEQLK